ncbi:hypothetical protein BDN72DRAFT_903139 [Pluteus cervinus]|uniref:Uncharacterized protein n=1 Tax=Pluteus cervinus TaxID=181527 RepID=A0ACD3A9Y1_9AGAR|nr:hypothetical protein BDN72DRAFT_903139 [Pluteus cervinus]
MISVILPLFFAFCLAANTLNPPTNLPIQVLFACLLLTTSPSLYDLAFTLALGLSTVFLFKHGIVQFTKAVSGVNVGAGLRRVRSRLDEGLGKVAGSLMNIKDTVIPGTFGAVLVVIITVFAIATKPTMSAALGDGMTIFAFVEDSLVDGSTMDLQDKIPTGQASLQVDKYIKLALGVMVIHASTPVARIAEAMIKIALSFLDNVAHHVESYVCDLAVKFVQCIRHESGMVHAQDFNQSVAFAIFDKLDQSARTLYRFLTAFEAAISFSVTVISFAVKDLTKVSRACWKDDIVTFAQQTKIPVPNIVFFCLDASITILLQICLCMLDVLPSILRWTVRGFYTMALLVELVAHVLLRLWRLSEEWTCSWKAARYVTII